MVHTHDPSFGEVEAGGSQIQGQSEHIVRKNDVYSSV